MSLSWAAPEGDGVAAALVEGTLLKLYSFDRFKSSQSGDDSAGGIESLEVCGEAVDGDEVERGRIAGVAANAARDLQNLPANVATPTFLAERAREIADEHEALELELLDREAIVERGMGAFASVAQGTHVEPRLIVLRYRPVRRERAAPGVRRQGRDLRHRRDLDQALGEDAGDEVRHVGRRRGHRVDGRDRRARRAGHRHRRGAVHGEHAERPRGEARRHRDRDERHDHRGEQHRRRGAADPRRRALLRRRAGRRADRGPRHAHGRDPGGARPHLLRALLERRRRGAARSEAPATRAARSAGACRSTPSTTS